MVLNYGMGYKINDGMENYLRNDKEGIPLFGITMKQFIMIL